MIERTSRSREARYNHQKIEKEVGTMGRMEDYYAQQTKERQEKNAAALSRAKIIKFSMIYTYVSLFVIAIRNHIPSDAIGRRLMTINNEPTVGWVVFTTAYYDENERGQTGFCCILQDGNFCGKSEKPYSLEEHYKLGYWKYDDSTLNCMVSGLCALLLDVGITEKMAQKAMSGKGEHNKAYFENFYSRYTKFRFWL